MTPSSVLSASDLPSGSVVSPGLPPISSAAAERAANIESDASSSADPPAAEKATKLSSDEVRRQDARAIHWSGLELGARYLLALFDVDANETTDYVVFSASE